MKIFWYIAAMWLGFSTGLTGANIYKWQWWVITIPTIIFFSLGR